MGDSYAEVIVHDEKDVRGKQLKLGLAVLTIALLCYGAMFHMTLFLIGVILIPVTIYTIKNRYREYEYLLVSDEIDITVIKNKQRRKKIRSYSLNDLQCMAPVRSHRLDGFHGNPGLKVMDYSSGNPEHNIYSMIFSCDGAIQEVKVEPSDTLLREVKMRHSSIVFSD